MIQRKQTIWLLIAALLSAGLFFFDLYRTNALVGGMTVEQYIRVNDDYLSLLLAIVMTALPFFAVFMYKARGRQKTMVLLSMVFDAAFIAYMLMRVSNANNGVSAPTNGSYWLGAVLPVLSFIFLIMAWGGIRKDEKLVKSLDRLR